jgi:nicotinate-nucleotide adenylyltransferase
VTLPRRIGLFGGSFDPPHLAHLALARLALDELALDELRWLPAGQPWQKAGRVLAPAADRIAMVGALIAAAPGGEPRFVLDTRETLRSGPSYTIDTVREIGAEAPGSELWLVIGQDQYTRLDTWRDWRELLQRVDLAVAARDGEVPRPPPALADAPHRLRVLPLPRMPIASTVIRAAAARGDDIAPMVGATVASYIAARRLYGATGKDAAEH